MARYDDLFPEKTIPDQRFRCWFLNPDPDDEIPVIEAQNIERAAEQFVEEYGTWDEGSFDVLVNPVKTSRIYKVNVSAHLELYTEAGRTTLTKMRPEGRKKPKRTPKRKPRKKK